MSTQIIYDKTMEVILRYRPDLTGNHLDIGSGSGGLIALVRKAFNVRSSACDYTADLMKLEGQKVEIADLNTQPLPYPDGSFDLITCTEVIEHLEHYRETLREIHRVAANGALIVFSTPNILNLKSRLRFLGFGFWNLFGPLHMKESQLATTGGHINPVSYFYLAHALGDAGFTRISVTVDKYQRSSCIPYLLLVLPIRFLGHLAFHKEEAAYKTIDSFNRPIVAAMNSRDLLLGRTVIVSATKAGHV